MAWRTTEGDVRGIVETDSTVNLALFIDIANALTDKVDSADADGDLSDALLTHIESLLAAHFYSLRDQLYANKSTGRASAGFQVGQGNGLAETAYGRNAIALDITGYLARLAMPVRPKASVTWLGKVPSEQTDYIDRD